MGTGTARRTTTLLLAVGIVVITYLTGPIARGDGATVEPQDVRRDTPDRRQSARCGRQYHAASVRFITNQHPRERASRGGNDGDHDCCEHQREDQRGPEAVRAVKPTV